MPYYVVDDHDGNFVTLTELNEEERGHFDPLLVGSTPTQAGNLYIAYCDALIRDKIVELYKIHRKRQAVAKMRMERK